MVYTPNMMAAFKNITTSPSVDQCLQEIVRLEHLLKEREVIIVRQNDLLVEKNRVISAKDAKLTRKKQIIWDLRNDHSPGEDR